MKANFLYLLGLDDTPYFDAGLREKELIQRALAALPGDYATARFIEQALAAARRVREEHSIPPDLGYVREAIRIASKIFGTIHGKTIAGTGPIADALLAHGAIRPADADAAQTCDLIISETEMRFRQYTFTMDDLDRQTREKIRKYYPADIFKDTFSGQLVENVADILEHGIKKDPEAAVVFKNILDHLAEKNDDAISDFMAAIIRAARP